MPEINRASDATNMIWKLVDRDTGKENGTIDWTFKVGDQSRSAWSTTWTRTTRCTTRSTSTAPAGSWSWPATACGANLVWKDTVLVRPARPSTSCSTSRTRPWMAHCHIAEHNQSGMMFSFDVTGTGHDRPRSDRSLDRLVADTAGGIVIPGVRRCLLRIENPTWPEGWTAAATTNPDDRDGLDSDVAFRIASVTKLVTATALLALADQGRCRLDDQTGQYLPGTVLDRFRDRQGHPYAARLTLRQLLDHTSGLPNYFTDPAILRRGARWRRPAPLHPARPHQPGCGRPTAVIAPRDGSLLHRHRVRAGRTHHRIAHRRTPRRGLPSSCPRPSRHDRHVAREQRRAAACRSAISPHDLEGRDISGMDPTVDWAGGGLVSTASDLAALLRGLTRGDLVGDDAWTSDDQLADRPSRLLRRIRTGPRPLPVPNRDLHRPPGFCGAFAFWSPELDAIVTGTVTQHRSTAARSSTRSPRHSLTEPSAMPVQPSRQHHDHDPGTRQKQNSASSTYPHASATPLSTIALSSQTRSD